MDYLQTSNEAEANRLLETILTDHVLPILRSIQAEKFREVRSEGASYQNQEAEEFLYETRARIAAALFLRWGDPESKPIDDLASYVAKIGYNSFSDYVRRKYPNRTDLANQVNYELKEQPTLARWKIAASKSAGMRRDEPHGGLKRWQEEGRAPIQSAVLLAFLADPRAWGVNALPNADPRKADLGKLLETIFHHVQTPVLLTRLVTALCELRSVKDFAPIQASETSASSADPIQQAWERRAREDYFESPRHNPAATAELRDLLSRSLEQVRILPRNQRVALLLHLGYKQDGLSIRWLPLIEVASQRELATIMEISINTLAECWYRLPLSDKEIAPLLGLTSTEVSSLRGSARKRLNWRMGER